MGFHIRLSAALIFSAIIISAFLWPHMPDDMAIHWNIMGEPDGYDSRLRGLFLTPAIMAGCFLFMLKIPKMDSLSHNIEAFRKEYEGLIWVLTLFLFVLHMQIITWNMGYRISPNIVMPAALACFFLYLGYLLPHVKRNHFIGIRTPWTLSDERVWYATHMTGARLFKISGLLAVFGLFTGRYAIMFLTGPVLGSLAYLFVYSYLLHRRLNSL